MPIPKYIDTSIKPEYIDHLIVTSQRIFITIQAGYFQNLPETFDPDQRVCQPRVYSDELTAHIMDQLAASKKTSEEAGKAMYEAWLSAAEKAITQSDHVTAAAIYRGLTIDKNGNENTLVSSYVDRLQQINITILDEKKTLETASDKGIALPMVPAVLTGHSKEKPYNSYDNYAANLDSEFQGDPNFLTYIQASQKAVTEKQHEQFKSRQPKQNWFFALLNRVIGFIDKLTLRMSDNQESGIRGSRTSDKVAESTVRTLAEEGMLSTTTTTSNAPSAPRAQHEPHSQGEIADEMNKAGFEDARKELYNRTKEKLNDGIAAKRKEITTLRDIKYKSGGKTPDDLKIRLKTALDEQVRLIDELEKCNKDWKNWQHDKDPTNPSNMFSDENIRAHINSTSKTQKDSPENRSPSRDPISVLPRGKASSVGTAQPIEQDQANAARPEGQDGSRSIKH